MLVDVGDTKAVTHYTRDADNNLVDPSSIAVTLKAPDGTVTSPSITHVGTGEHRVGAPITVAGDWLLTWTTVGPDDVEGVEISGLPPGAAVPWAPELRMVGSHIPSRTRQVESDNNPIGTFNEFTYPTGDIVSSLIGSASAVVQGMVGIPVVPVAYSLCQTAAALWSAYWVELGFPERDADVAIYERLRADALLITEQARALNVAAGGGTVDPPDEAGVITGLSSFSFPDPGCPIYL